MGEVCNKYIYILTDPITLPCSLARVGKYMRCFDMNDLVCVLVELLCCQNQDSGKNSHYEGKV